MTGETLQRRNHLIKLRDLLTCQMCQKIAPEPELEVDHIIPIWKDGEDEPDNLQTLCKACHESKTIDEGSRKTKKKTFYFDENGWKVFDS